ncbi:hypothetical protein EV383_2057 [Pseudonocardia sediminis]|uniref:Uncharacterized protein n=1 Tax=Pseudonocardia sediminis TaxID=1397368 RepID=A0A4Q7UY93_PSEST|nr:hypothetical protein [Pseudonocardia sediminis]RZT85193.1 hypothetical protein EV383_2057 [Pseudonocardia sediminis]
MRARTRIAVLAGLALVVVLAAFVAGNEGGAPTPARTAGSVRLGPDPGQAVAEYRADLARRLPAPGEETLALVQLARPLDTTDAAALAGPSEVVTGVFRVPLPRVQTALRFEPVTGTGDAAGALDVARQRAAFAAGADVSRLTGRPAAVATAEQRALDTPTCACLPAFVVRADRARLEALAVAPGVRAVDAAPVGTQVTDLALAPLLPEQTTAADPLPDDGPVPQA